MKDNKCEHHRHKLVNYNVYMSSVNKQQTHSLLIMSERHKGNCSNDAVGTM